MIEIKSYGEIKDGKFIARNPEFFKQQIKDAGNVNECLLSITGSNIRTIRQNNYAHAVCNQIANRMQKDGWDVTGYMVYKRLEEAECKTEVINSKTGRSVEFTRPLKEQDSERFGFIVEQARVNAMNTYPDIYIKTPAEFYNLTEDAYELWRTGVISFVEAKRQSES